MDFEHKAIVGNLEEKMKFCGTSVALLLAASAGVVSSSILRNNSNIKNNKPAASFGVSRKNGKPFGVSVSRNDLITAIQRGGATATATAENTDEETEQKPQVLYLPGLLEITVAKKKVCIIIAYEYNEKKMMSVAFYILNVAC